MTGQLPLHTIDSAAHHRLMIESDPNITTLADAIRAAAEFPACPSQDHGIVLLNSQGQAQSLTYTELWLAARRVASGLHARGSKPGDRVLLLLPTSDTYVITLCATILLGLVPCTVAAPTVRTKTQDGLRFLSYVYEKLDPIVVIVPAQLQHALQEHPALDTRRVVTPDELMHNTPFAVELLKEIDPAQTHHIQLTSGSTSRPKGVVLSHHNVIANIRGIGRSIDYDPHTDIILSWLPLYHDMGLIKLLKAIYYQATIMLMTPTSFLRNPLSWLRNISTYRATLSAAPTFAYGLCIRKFDPAKLTDVDLSSWRRAFVGAEPVPRSIVEEFIHRYQPYGMGESAMYPCYGMAETVLATTLPVDRQPQTQHLAQFVSCDHIDANVFCRERRAVPRPMDALQHESTLDMLGMGYPVQGLEVSIRSADDEVLPNRLVGEITVRGTSLMSEYFRDPEATAQAIRDGWYHTGDQGYMIDGELYVIGRIKELIIVRGRNYQPSDVELVIEEHEHVRKGYSVAFSIYNERRGTDDVVVIVETRAAAEQQLSIAYELQQSLQAVFGFLARDIVFVPHGTLPRTTSGKKQRLLAQEWYRASKFTIRGEGHGTNL